MTRREKLFAWAGGMIGAAVGFAPLELARSLDPPSEPAASAVTARATADPCPVTAGDDGVDAAMAANANLTESLHQCSRDLGRVTEDNSRLEQQMEGEHSAELDAGRAALARRMARRNLSREDWKELARTGTVKYALPCASFDPSPEVVTRLGLNPRDVPTVRDAFGSARDSAWAQIKPLCTAAAGGAAQADKLGLESCPQIILASQRATSPSDADDAMRAVASARAGLLDPSAIPNGNPVAVALMALTAISSDAEGRVAARLGPEDARVAVYGNTSCTRIVELPGPGPR